MAEADDLLPGNDSPAPDDSMDDGSTDDDSTDDDGSAADVVRAALSRARAAASARGLLPSARPGPAAGPTRRRPTDQAARSGAGPDARDPQPMARSIDRLVVERGWQAPVAVGGVLGRWDQVVGAEVAAHCRAESFDAGVLVVRTDSTAWATQVRLLGPTVLRRLDEELGPGVVERLVVRGPGAPSWRRGPRVAPGGRGPRDTYG